MMKKGTLQFACLCVVLAGTMSQLHAQFEIEHLGLKGMDLSSMDINFGILAVGSEENGVYWQFEGSVSDTAWQWIALPGRTAHAVYPHKSGPIGWAISAGVSQEHPDSAFVYCSFMGEDFFPNSDGITPELTTGIYDLDGYPDPTICGETYGVGDRALFRRQFTDTTWETVFEASIEGYLQTVKVREEYPGVVMLGGADGFAGILLTRSTDFGDTWEDISPFGATFDVDFAGLSGDTIFVASSDKIFRTVDGGKNWDIIYQDGIAYHFTEILYNAEDNTVYAAGGTFTDQVAVLLQSRDFGNTWEQVQLDTLDAILDLEFGGDGWVYFATRENGVYRVRGFLSGTRDVVKPDKRFQLTVTPNPFGSTAQISFELPSDNPVIIRVCDQQGKMLEMLLHEHLPMGKHVLNWDAERLIPGNYMLILDVGKIRQARQVIHISE